MIARARYCSREAFRKRPSLSVGQGEKHGKRGNQDHEEAVFVPTPRTNRYRTRRARDEATCVYDCARGRNVKTRDIYVKITRRDRSRAPIVGSVFTNTAPRPQRCSDYYNYYLYLSKISPQVEICTAARVWSIRELRRKARRTNDAAIYDQQVRTRGLFVSSSRVPKGGDE